MHKQAKLDWAKDVKPAFGKELDFAWLDFENNGRNFVALVKPDNDAKFNQLIAKANSSETDPANRPLSDYVWRCYEQVTAFNLYLVLERRADTEGC